MAAKSGHARRACCSGWTAQLRPNWELGTKGPLSSSKGQRNVLNPEGAISHTLTEQDHMLHVLPINSSVKARHNTYSINGDGAAQQSLFGDVQTSS